MGWFQQFGGLVTQMIGLLALSLVQMPLFAQEVLQLDVYPREFTVIGAREQLQIVAMGKFADNQTVDLTRRVTFQVEPADLATVNSQGQVIPSRDGRGVIRVGFGDLTQEIRLSTKDIQVHQAVSFDYHALPVLAQSGCSGGSCHGSPHGKAGFRLSLFGSDRELDRLSLTMQQSGRRLNPIEPEESLLLLKPTSICF